MKCDETWVSFDVETTGFGKNARILEVGMVLFEQGEVADQSSWLLNPRDVNWGDADVQKALAINGLTRAELEGKPEFSEVYQDIVCHMLSTRIWVGHNMPFDLRMLQQELRKITAFTHAFPPLGVITHDTLKLDRQFHPAPAGHKLDDLAARWGVTVEGVAHRAVTDAVTCGKVLQQMRRRELTEMRGLQKHAVDSWRAQY